MDAFDRFDFAASPAWIRYREESVLTSDADALLLAKAKWYRKNVDGEFDVDLVRSRIRASGIGAGGGSASSSSRPSAPPPPPPPKPSASASAAPPRPSRPAAAAAPASSRSSNLSPRALLSSLSSASPLDAAALASRLATLITGLAFLLACLSSWLSLLGLGRLLGKEAEPDYYSPRSRPASAAAFRRFALSATVSHFCSLFQKCGVPPVAPVLRGGSFNPQAMGPLLSWMREASQAADANLLFFLMLSSSSPSSPAAVPSLVAALFALLESSSGSSGIGKLLFPTRALRSLLESHKPRAAQAAAASELAQGIWLAVSTVLGKGGGFLTAMGFWRTYAPMRLRGSPEFRGAAVALAGGAAKAARKVSGGGGGNGVAAFFERLEARLSHSD